MWTSTQPGLVVSVSTIWVSYEEGGIVESEDSDEEPGSLVPRTCDKNEGLLVDPSGQIIKTADILTRSVLNKS